MSHIYRSSAAVWGFHWCRHCPPPDFLEVSGTLACCITLLASGRTSSFLISYLVQRPKTLNCPVCVLPDTMNGMERKKPQEIVSEALFLSNLQNNDGPRVSRGLTGDDRSNNHHLGTKVHPRSVARIEHSF